MLRANRGAEEPAILIARLLLRRVGRYEASICFDFHQRLVFTNDGVGVVIRSVELYHLVKSDHSDSAYDSVVNDQVKTRLSESQAEAEELDQSKSVGKCIVIGLSFCFCFCFRLRQSGFH